MSYKNFETPIGVARFPKIDKPYRYDQSLRKSVPDPDEGKFEIEIVVSGEAAHPFMEKIKQAAKDGGLKKVKNWPWKEELDKETDEPTGNIIIVARKPAKAKTGLPNRVVQVDAKGRPLPTDFRLTSGSRVRANGYVNVYTTLGGGVSLRLDSVQVIKLQEQGPRGFTAVEDEDAFVYEAAADDAAETNNNDAAEPSSGSEEESYDF